MYSYYGVLWYKHIANRYTGKIVLPDDWKTCMCSLTKRLQMIIEMHAGRLSTVHVLCFECGDTWVVWNVFIYISGKVELLTMIICYSNSILIYNADLYFYVLFNGYIYILFLSVKSIKKHKKFIWSGTVLQVALFVYSNILW